MMMQHYLTDDLKDVVDVAITHDGWTSINTESFSSTTVHFIDGKWRLKTAVLETKKITGSHTAEAIAKSVRETQLKWNLPSKPIAVTDNAANEKKAFEILDWERFGCFGHVINLIVKKALAAPEIGRLLGKARKLVTFCHQSSSINDIFLERQGKILQTDNPHKLIMDCPTRWNSTLSMLQRLCEQTVVLYNMANDTSLPKTASTTLRNCIYTFEEQLTIERMVTVLAPFERATTILCADQTPTLQKVVPIITKLERCLALSDEDTPALKAMKTTMKQQLDNRCEAKDLILLACVLNPFTKDMGFLPAVESARAHSLLREKVCQKNVHIKKEGEPSEPQEDASSLPFLPEAETGADKSDEPTPEVPAAKPYSKLADMDDWLDDIVFAGTSKTDINLLGAQEVERYLTAEVRQNSQSGEVQTLLEWWAQNEFLYPRIAVLAKKYLAVPATSVPSERVFSLAGIIVNKKRSRLSPTNIDTMIFMNKNISYW